MFMETGWKDFVDAGSPPSGSDQLTRTVARLQPAAAQALLASFRTEMAAAVEQRVQAELATLLEADTGP
jgi:hypothetical protein